MPSARKFARKAFQCACYEAQDVLLKVDDVDLICLEPGRGFAWKESWQRRLLYRDVSGQLIYLNPGLHKVRLTHEYDLFVLVCQYYWDLLYINAIDGWEDCCKTKVCWIDEMWAAEMPLFKYWLGSLRRFDHVFIAHRGSATPLSNAINQTCHWLPSAVDTLRFSPYPNPPVRVIDVYSIGRRWEGIHRALLQAAEYGQIFYVYDTFQGADAEVFHQEQHRDLFANMAKRSRCFVVAPPKMDVPGETQGQVEIGYRYYEGASAGAVMIGQAPDCEAFRELFPWQDAVVSIQPDGSDVMEVLSGFACEPERASAISRKNAAEALLHHDWVYRWHEIFRVAGIEPSPRMAARERRLRDLADLALNTVANDASIMRLLKH
jgi:hypothetical protein